MGNEEAKGVSEPGPQSQPVEPAKAATGPPAISEAKQDDRKLGTVGLWFLGIYLYAVIPILIFLVMTFWPLASIQNKSGAKVDQDQMARQEQALMATVALLGALGGSLHAASSFSTYVGNRSLMKSWVGWYFVRAPAGAVLALIFYYLVRGGLLGFGTGAQDGFNLYGIGSLALLAGLFSDMATDKLKEVFAALFRPKSVKKDPITQAAPVIQKVEPDPIPCGSKDISVTIFGESFEESDRAFLDGRPLNTTFTSPTELKATIPAEKIANPGTLKLQVRHAGPRGASSNLYDIPVK